MTRNYKFKILNGGLFDYFLNHFAFYKFERSFTTFFDSLNQSKLSAFTYATAEIQKWG